MAELMPLHQILGEDSRIWNDFSPCFSYRTAEKRTDLKNLEWYGAFFRKNIANFAHNLIKQICIDRICRIESGKMIRIMTDGYDGMDSGSMNRKM